MILIIKKKQLLLILNENWTQYNEKEMNLIKELKI